MRVQIGIDDLSPRPTQSFELWANVERLLHVGFKIDLFVPFALIRDGDGPYVLTEYPKFVERLRKTSKLPNVTLNVHGYHHGWANQNNDEFLLGDKDTLDERLSKIDSLIEETGLDFKKVFRPPAWKISQDGVDLLIKHGYTHLALYNGNKEGAYYNRFYSHLNLDGIKVHYCNSAPPHDLLKSTGDDLSLTYHFNTWLRNKISYEFVEDLYRKFETATGFDFDPYHIYEM